MLVRWEERERESTGREELRDEKVRAREGVADDVEDTHRCVRCFGGVMSKQSCDFVG